MGNKVLNTNMKTFTGVIFIICFFTQLGGDRRLLVKSNKKSWIVQTKNKGNTTNQRKQTHLRASKKDYKVGFEMKGNADSYSYEYEEMDATQIKNSTSSGQRFASSSSSSCKTDAKIEIEDTGIQGTGRVRTCKNRKWGTLCGNFWSDNNKGAENICRSKGFTGGVPYTVPGASGPINYGNRLCKGGEKRIKDCPLQGGLIDTFGCTHQQDQGVQCDTPEGTCQGTCCWREFSQFDNHKHLLFFNEERHSEQDTVHDCATQCQNLQTHDCQGFFYLSTRSKDCYLLVGEPIQKVFNHPSISQKVFNHPSTPLTY